MKITSYNVIYYMNSEGITLRVLKATFLPSTKCILNIHVLKMNKRKKKSHSSLLFTEYNVFKKETETQQSLLFLVDFICGLCN